MAVHEELEAILHRLQQMREQLLVIKVDGQSDGSDPADAGQTTALDAESPASVEPRLH